ncbi:hypothetical protein DSOL_5399 [Desulfosporosinus metallidurans]|uniref:SHOCT domain-containing protein n=1 Tax=Desulfosporosinus metallidurans TaxID=1888891 RepID=A0A1Q8QC09_9FIRM|nr:hypothetical protein DSOL_5399 [Desulfosporosinus metallidurans]
MVRGVGKLILVPALPLLQFQFMNGIWMGVEANKVLTKSLVFVFTLIKYKEERGIIMIEVSLLKILLNEGIISESEYNEGVEALYKKVA